MGSRISEVFALDPEGQEPGRIWEDPLLLSVVGYLDFMGNFAGRTFEGGLYRLHNSRSGPAALDFIDDYFPERRGRVRPFGADWLGRQFVLDLDRVVRDEHLVLLLEPGTGQALEVPKTFQSFHDDLHALREPALAESFFYEWNRAGGPRLNLLQCAGYNVPLFLGGEDTIENLSVQDVEVYWSLLAQLRNAPSAVEGLRVRGVGRAKDGD